VWSPGEWLLKNWLEGEGVDVAVGGVVGGSGEGEGFGGLVEGLTAEGLAGEDIFHVGGSEEGVDEGVCGDTFLMAGWEGLANVGITAIEEMCW
jgi:hypothetical protein